MCVRGQKNGWEEKCKVDDDTGVLQDTNIAISTSSQRAATAALKGDLAMSKCTDEANSADGTANDQGASSCITSETLSTDVLSAATFTTEQAANDAMGDGDETSCEEISWFFDTTAGKITAYIALAIGLAFAGIGAGWGSIFVYNKCKARHEEYNKEHFGDDSWKKPEGQGIQLSVTRNPTTTKNLYAKEDAAMID